MKFKFVLPLLIAATLIGACQSETGRQGSQSAQNTKSCENVQCDKLCRDGVCIDQECLSKSDCSGEKVCLNGLCVEPEKDGCNPACTAGVCDKVNNRCVNDVICTEATERERCVAGNVCVNNKCVAANSICDTLNCQRGICDESNRRCVNVANGQCLTADQCLDGYYCDSATHNCTPNSCRPDGTCARGVCDKDAGKCVNPPSCRASGDCVDGSYCVDNAGTKECVEKASLCAGGCRGSQICQYDEHNLTAECQEGLCTTAYDCTANRICNLSSHFCGPTPACTQDAYGTSPINYATTQVSGSIADLKVCDGETDTFEYEPTVAGKLGVVVTRPVAEVGLGNLKITIKDDAGNEVGTVGSEQLKDKGRVIELAVDVAAANINKKWTIEVEGEKLGGTANYTIFIYNIEESAYNTCSQQEEFDLQSGGTVRSKIEYDGATYIPISCVTSPIATYAGSNVYHFTVTEKSYVTFSAKRLTTDSAIGLEIRPECQDSTNYVACAHQNAAGTPFKDEVSALLEPGDYSLIVTGWRGEKNGSTTSGFYALTGSAVVSTCEPNKPVGTCQSNEVTICNEDGVTTRLEKCPNGCDSVTNLCLHEDGDSCTAPIVVTEATPFDGGINLTYMKDDYHETSTCGGAIPADQIVGKDVVFKVTVPQGKFLFAEGGYGVSKVNVPFYILENGCSDLTACVSQKEATLHQKTLFRWKNDGTADKDIYLVADTSKEDLKGKLDAHIWIGDEVCAPGSKKCIKSSQSITCNEIGTRYLDEIEECTFGCQDDNTQPNYGACKASTLVGDSCATPKQLTPGTPLTAQNMEQFNDLSGKPGDGLGGAGCGNLLSSNGYNGDHDAFYSVVTTQPDKVIEVKVKPDSGQRLMVWQVDGCNADGTAGLCLFGDASGSGTEVTIQVAAPTAGTYTFEVAPESSSRAAGNFEITANILDRNSETNKIIGCSASGTAIKYTDHLGVEHEHECDSGSCDSTTNRCASATMASCAEAKALTGLSGSESDSYVSSDNNIELHAGYVGNCYIPKATAGSDRFFTLHLNQGQLLTVTNNNNDSSKYLYIQEGCGGPDSCHAFVEKRGVIQYYAKDNPVDLTIVADSASYSVSYSFDWEITTPSDCPAGYQTCTSESDGYSCDGTSAPQTFSCTNGVCRGGVCESNDGPATCSLAEVVTSPFSQILDFSKTEGGDALCLSQNLGLVKNGAKVKPYLYRVHALEGEVIEANVENISGGFGYAFIAKNDLCSSLQDSCLNAVQTETSGVGKTATVKYLVPVGEEADYIVGFVGGSAPSFLSSPSGFLKVSINVGAVTCTDASPTSCESSGGKNYMKYCENYEWTLLECSGGCTANKCDNPKGDICQDAIPFDTQSGDSGTTAEIPSGGNFKNDIDFGRGLVDGCSFGFGSPGSVIRGEDAYYSVDLNKDDTLSVRVTDPQSNDIIYVTDSCTSAGTCYASSINIGYNSNEDEQSLVFQAPKTGTYYVIVDQTSPSSHLSSYLHPKKLEWNITRASTSGPCVPSAHQCTAANKLSYCNDIGAKDEITCPASSSITGDLCSFGYCQLPPEADSCQTAPLIEGDFYTMFNFATLTNTFDLLSDTSDGIGSCDTDKLDGADAFFAFKLKAHEKLHVSLQNTTKDSDFGVSYFFFDSCDFIGRSCHSGGGLSDNKKKYPFIDQAEYLNDSDNEKTIYLGLDTWNKGSSKDGLDYPVILHTWTENADCNSLPEYQNGAIVCHDGTLTYCDSQNYLAKYRCESGCTADPSSNIDYCDSPKGNTCTDPYTFTLTTSGKTKSGTTVVTLSDQENTFELPNGGPMCGPARTPGQDAIYAIDLEAGDTVTAKAKSKYSSPYDIAIYFATSCDIPNACLTSDGDMHTKQDSSQYETITYTASSKERIYLVVDSLTNMTSSYRSKVEVDVTITSP